MREKTKTRVAAAPFELEWLDLPGEEIPLDNNSVDTVVLKPDGKLLFSEHGKAPDDSVQRWQNRIDPVWGKLAGGCHLNRNIPSLLREGGFDVKDLDKIYIPSTPKVADFTYWGYAG